MTEQLRGTALLALSTALSARNHKLAIQIMWELHSHEVFRYCCRMLANDAEAADVTQKVFEHAIRDLDRLRSADSTSRWLLGIARHRCLDHARSARRDPRLVDADTLCRIAGAAFVAEPATNHVRVVTLLGQCLQRLDARDRALIEMRFYEGLPFKEIAKQLGGTPAALRVRMTRACVLLRKHLKTALVNGSGHESPQAAPGASGRPISHAGHLDSSNGELCLFSDPARFCDVSHARVSPP